MKIKGEHTAFPHFPLAAAAMLLLLYVLCNERGWKFSTKSMTILLYFHFVPQKSSFVLVHNIHTIYIYNIKLITRTDERNEHRVCERE